MSAAVRRYLPALVLLLALLLRLWGIGWGLPDERHAFSYHPDESRVLGQAVLQPGQSLLDTGFYNYGSLATLTDRLLLLTTGTASTSIPSASSLLLARLVTVAYGVGTCALLLLLGRRWETPGVGLGAATLYALAPLAVQHGHFATVDVPATFWVTACLVAALTLPQPASPGLKATPSGSRATSPASSLGAPSGFAKGVFFCGLFAGLAAATKYNAGMVLLAGVAAWAQGEARSLKSLALLLGGAALGFLIGCPGVVVNFPQFWHDFTFELAHARQPDSYFVHGPSGFVHWPSAGLAAALGFPLSLLALLALFRRDTPLPVHAFVWPYFLLLCTSANQYERYLLPLLPALCWLMAGPAPRLWRTLVVVGGAVALAFSLALCSVMAATDPRDQAAAFLKQQGVASVGFARGPWFWSPPLHPGLSSPLPTVAREMAAQSTSVRLVAVPPEREWDIAFLEETDPDAVALSEIEYSAAQSQRDPRALAYLRVLHRRYAHRTVFANSLPFLASPGLVVPYQHLPIDLIYPNPTIVIFTK